MLLRFHKFLGILLWRINFKNSLPTFKAMLCQESCKVSIVLSPEDQPTDEAAISSNLKFCTFVQKLSISLFVLIFVGRIEFSSQTRSEFSAKFRNLPNFKKIQNIEKLLLQSQFLNIAKLSLFSIFWLTFAFQFYNFALELVKRLS